ncbi:MAG: efflux RND transporter periplasmic adaptor subunit, partial [Cytophagales bacterium]|nr:efflux RND transporter periplasmic adaptor subunit [Cytophagales bacterium]
MMQAREILIKLFWVMLIHGLIISCSPEKKKEIQKEHTDRHSDMLVISDQDRLLANITTSSAEVKNISEMTILVGKTAIDEQKVEVITSRVRGRVDVLYVKNPGEYIQKGQAIYGIYSEELLADENDFLLAIDQYKNAISQKEIALQLLEAARKKLLLWTLTEGQIKALENSKKATPLIKFYAPYSGYAIELPVREGEYVEVGAPILKLADFSSLWIETQVYSDEIHFLKQNPSLQIEFEAYPNK